MSWVDKLEDFAGGAAELIGKELDRASAKEQRRLVEAESQQNQMVGLPEATGPKSIIETPVQHVSKADVMDNKTLMLVGGGAVVVLLVALVLIRK